MSAFLTLHTAYEAIKKQLISVRKFQDRSDLEVQGVRGGAHGRQAEGATKAARPTFSFSENFKVHYK